MYVYKLQSLNISSTVDDLTCVFAFWTNRKQFLLDGKIKMGNWVISINVRKEILGFYLIFRKNYGI